MRGNFNNSVEHFSRLGPNRHSTAENAHRIAEALRIKTGRAWIVTLNATRDITGGFYVSPPQERLRGGKMSRRDWRSLVDLLGVVATLGARRYYIFPDEIPHVLWTLENGHPKDPYAKRLDEIERRVLGNERR